MAVRFVEAAVLRDRLRSGDEVAVLDAREQGVFSKEHLFWGSCVPLSHLELLVEALVPRRTCPVVWVDDGGTASGTGDLAARAAARMAELGWSNVSVLRGGVAGWPGERYSGVNVPSKAFGEWVERQEHTPHISAIELHRRQAGGERLVILDSRPMREFQRMSIPGGVDCPGAELVFRINDMVTDPDTTVVVNCAGRTRSIIGAQSLRNAGIPNPVMALEHGTMGWELAGFALAHGETTHAPVPSATGLARAQELTATVAGRFGVRTVDDATLRSWLADPDRTTFVLDVRTAEEYAAGHAPFARHAPGGQVVQATDEYVGVLGARVVLVDDGSLVRATMTASWLVQFGRYEVAVAPVEPTGSMTRTAPSGTVPVGSEPVGSEPVGMVGAGMAAVGVPIIDVAELAARLGSVEVIDLANSLRYRRGHIAGACWAVRSRLDQVTGIDGPVVLTSPDAQLARLAWADADARWPGAVVLDGGTNAWIAAGQPLEAGLTRTSTDTDDVWYKPYDAEDQAVARQHMQDYLDWEVALLKQIDHDELVQFQAFPA